MKRIIIFALALFAVAQVHATTNIPLSCKKTPAVQTLKELPWWHDEVPEPAPKDPKAAVCQVEDYQCVLGKAGLYIATPSGVWTRWEDLAASDVIRAYPNDLVPGQACSGSRTNILKSQAATEANEIISSPVKVTWQLPTTLTNNAPILPANPITKVQLVWGIDHHIPDDPAVTLPASGFTTVDLAGTATEYQTVISSRPQAVLYVRARVQLKSGEVSAFSGEAYSTLMPVKSPPNFPASVSINGSQPSDME